MEAQSTASTAIRGLGWWEAALAAADWASQCLAKSGKNSPDKLRLGERQTVDGAETTEEKPKQTDEGSRGFTDPEGAWGREWLGSSQDGRAECLGIPEQSPGGLATSRYLPWPHTLPWEGQGTAGKEARELANGRPWWEALA